MSLSKAPAKTVKRGGKNGNDALPHKALGRNGGNPIVRPRIQYDAEYISYVENGESAAVFIARDIATEVPTAGRWIDVLSSRGYKRNDNRWDFSEFDVELFPRHKRPVYPPKCTEEDRKYITWKTAHEDIEEQRRKGVRGEKYRIYPELINKKQGQYEIVKALWSNLRGRWAPPGSEKSPSKEWRDRRVPVKPEWVYIIKSVKKL